jgi:hypothetical protein
MTCPKCGSNEWKLASVIHAGGLSATSTMGAGVGVGNDLSVGVGGAKGTYQTELSKLAAPPTKGNPPAKILSPKAPRVGKIMGGYLFALVVIYYLNRHVSSLEYPLYTNMIFLGLPAGFMLLGVGLAFYMRDPEVDEKNRIALIAYEVKYKLALSEYERTKMCLRCGELFLDGDKTEHCEPTALPEKESSLATSTTKQCPFCAETILAGAVLCKHCHSTLS